MAAEEAQAVEREQCQARPVVVRHGWREDVLCASAARTTIHYHGREMPVCWMHRRMWERWGPNAPRNAAEQWGWPGV
jgi:hypothetical protein